MEGYTRDRLHLESTNPPGHPEPLSRERSGDNSEELLLHRGGRYSGSAEKFIRAMKGAAISLWAAREPRATSEATKHLSLSPPYALDRVVSDVTPTVIIAKGTAQSHCIAGEENVPMIKNSTTPTSTVRIIERIDAGTKRPIRRERCDSPA